MLLTNIDIYGREDTDYSAHLHHRNDKNIRNRVLFHLFANSIGQTAAILIPNFYIFFKKMKNGFNEDGAAHNYDHIRKKLRIKPSGSRIFFITNLRIIELLKEDEKWICNDEVASISHLGDCHSVIT